MAVGVATFALYDFYNLRTLIQPLEQPIRETAPSAFLAKSLSMKT